MPEPTVFSSAPQRTPEVVPATKPRHIDLAHLRAIVGLDDHPQGDEPPLTGNKIRVCVLAPSYEGSLSVTKEWDNITCGPQHFLTGPLAEGFKIDVVFLKKSTVYKDIRALATAGDYDVYYNLCDGAKDEDRAGVEVVQALEEFGLPFTGAASKYYELSKPTMKMVAHYNGIKAPRGTTVKTVEDAARKCAALHFPVIIKHPCGYGSVGMTKDCKCTSMDALLKRLDAFLKEHKSALVEEFIIGDEATVLACADDSQPDGVRVFLPVMVNFPKGEDFKHFALKWCDFDGMEWIPVPQDHPSRDAIIDIGRKAFKFMCGGIGYGRSDVRISASGEVYFLEINPNCGMLYPDGMEGSADWIAKLDPTTSHVDFILMQMRMAVQRAKALKPKFERDYDPARGYHLRALVDIPAGAVIMADEGRTHRLVTKPYVASQWRDEDRQQFVDSAWPLGADRHFYAIWDEDPDLWRPFNHSCDPNMAFGPHRSLNIVATRPIAAHEELTMDYATFSDPEMAPFECHCGSARCRGTVRGSPVFGDERATA